jgi:predicted Ser/Thr protein kinase
MPPAAIMWGWGDLPMTGELRAPASLRPGDPRRLGPYEILGRLGEGGMGTVYLARSPQGVRVAVKMVRADLAPDDEFRRRFRSEVNRVRQVPPFCTAEVLDADPDHEQPYLVVEYVDGPSLAEVVQERGPLSSANLHSVAIGVATALTAIHGAGVIHRDLKPRNVLLAPGSPKVIDFGIARALEATSAHTRTDQMVGTVAYMAPERFGSEPGTTLTPAADIFAWGAVVAYAGTGRTPFSADSPPATAARILTQPPDLSGLTGALRDLVGHSLEKNPADRPTARELLDMLLASGPQRSAATAAALAHQPGLRAAAREAQAATDYASERQLTAVALPAEFADTTKLRDDAEARSGAEADAAGPDAFTPKASRPEGDGEALTRTVPPNGPTSLLRTARPVGQDSIETQPIATRAAQARPRPLIPRQALRAPISPAGPPPPPERDDPRRRWVLPAALALLLLGLLATGLFISRLHPLDVTEQPAETAGTGAIPSVTTAGSTQPSTSPTALRPLTIKDMALGGLATGRSAPPPVLLVEDPLARATPWVETSLDPEKARCYFDDGALVAQKETGGSFRCKGPQDLRNTVGQAVEVDVRLESAGSCAALWMRFRQEFGYLVRVCAAAVHVGTHRGSVPATVQSLSMADDPIVVGAPSTRITVAARGNQIEVLRDGRSLGTVPLLDPDITAGRMVLGIFTESAVAADPAPYRVRFSNVRFFALDG